MTDKLRPCLTMLLALAASAVAASSAFAQESGELTTSTGGAVTLIGSQIEPLETEPTATEILDEEKTNTETTAVQIVTTERAHTTTYAEAHAEKGPNIWTMFGGVAPVCHASAYTGHKAEVTPHEPIASGATKLTLTPHYNQTFCWMRSGETKFPMTIDMNGCDNVLTIGGTKAANTYAVSTRIDCPPNQSIQWTTFSSSSHAFRLCTWTFKAQEPVSNGQIVNTGTDDLRLEGSFKEFHIQKTGLCGASTTTGAELHVGLTLEGIDVLGEPLGVTVTD